MHILLIPKVLFISFWAFAIFGRYLGLHLFLEILEFFYKYDFFRALWEANFHKKWTHGLGIIKLF